MEFLYFRKNISVQAFGNIFSCLLINRTTPPTIPARKLSRAGQLSSDNNTGPPPPQRPPKPGRPRQTGTLQSSPDNNISAGYSQDDTSSTNTIDDDENNIL